MKDYKNVDEFMDDLEKMAVAKSHGEHSQLFEDYFTLRQWYEEKFWQSSQTGLAWKIDSKCINEMRKILHALDMSELKTLADRGDRLASDVYTRRCVENLPRAEYDGNVTDFISELESKLGESENT